MRSSTRPGVPTINWEPASRASCWFLMETPPYTARLFRPVCAAIREHSCSTWMAGSREGHKTRQLGALASRGFSLWMEWKCYAFSGTCFGTNNDIFVFKCDGYCFLVLPLGVHSHSFRPSRMSCDIHGCPFWFLHSVLPLCIVSWTPYHVCSENPVSSIFCGTRSFWITLIDIFIMEKRMTPYKLSEESGVLAYEIFPKAFECSL